MTISSPALTVNRGLVINKSNSKYSIRRRSIGVINRITCCNRESDLLAESLDHIRIARRAGSGVNSDIVGSFSIGGVLYYEGLYRISINAEKLNADLAVFIGGVGLFSVGDLNAAALEVYEEIYSAVNYVGIRCASRPSRRDYCLSS